MCVWIDVEMYRLLFDIEERIVIIIVSIPAICYELGGWTDGWMGTERAKRR